MTSAGYAAFLHLFKNTTFHNTSLWNKLSPKLRRQEGIDLTPEELEAEAEQLENVEPLPEHRIASILRKVKGQENDIDIVTPELAWSPEFDTRFVEEGVLQLNRNRAADDEEVQEKLKELRRRALEQNNDEDPNNDLETD